MQTVSEIPSSKTRKRGREGLTWRFDAHERLKPSYDCDLVFEDVECAPDPVRGGTPHGTSHRLPDQCRPDHPVGYCMRIVWR